jgi:hypothetical protein
MGRGMERGKIDAFETRHQREPNRQCLSQEQEVPPLGPFPYLALSML